MCPSTLDALNTWIKYLQQRYPALGAATVIYDVDFDSEFVNRISNASGNDTDYNYEIKLL